MTHTASILRRPQAGTYAPFYRRYVDLVGDEDIVALLVRNKEDMIHFLESIGWEKWEHAYAPGKWTLAEVVGHIIDGERVFAYRALRIARNDKTPLPGFEQDDYVPFSGAAQRLPESLVREYAAVREATIQLFENFTDEMWDRVGMAAGSEVTPLALAYIIAGHELHHRQVIEKHYL